MRLVCPGCKAEYEVGDSAIPATGRDVQCSACGHIWLQAPAGGWPEGAEPDHGGPEATGDAGEEADGAGNSSPPGAEPETSADEPQQEASRDDVIEEPEIPGPDRATEPTGGADGAEAQKTSEPPPRRNPAASPEVIAILREEAEREARARRRGSAAGLEVQSDLGLTDAPPPRPEPSGDDVPPPAPRGLNRLPAIDEIDTTSLRPAPRRLPPGAAEAAQAAAIRGGGARSRGRYRTGFLVSVMIAIAAALVYARAGDIAAALPEAGSAIDAYAAGIDGLRLQLDEAVRAAVAALAEFAARAGA